jgi:hypothetical protein
VPDRILYLLQYDGAEEVRLMLVMRLLQDALRDTHQVIPKWFPLVLFIPHVWPLKERNDESLGLHEDKLRRADLCFQATDNS